MTTFQNNSISEKPSGDPAHDVFRGDRGALDLFFRPRSVALIGASETPGSVGRTLLQNLTAPSFPGTVYPINPRRGKVLNHRAYARLSDVPDAVDLAVIATPAPTVPEVVSQCVALGVPAAIVISAGFKEHGAAGAALEQQIMERAHQRMRLLGPNCLGLMCPPTGLNATFATPMALSGSVAFLSQSGALCTSVLDWSFQKKIGFSAFVSLGSMLDVGWGDLIDYLGNDPKTESIVMYMESIGDARSFLSAAREVALNKPIIVIKAGRTAGAAQAAVSHTGSLVGRDDVLDVAFERVGVTRVDSIGDLFHMAAALAKQPRPRGPRLTIVTNAGGPGVLAADALLQNGGVLAELSSETKEVLNGFLPAPWSHGNPVDVLGDADADRFAGAFETALRDPNSDGLLVVLSPQAMTDPTGTARRLVERLDKTADKTVLASWMGGACVEEGRRLLADAGVPTMAYPDTAARIFCTMWAHSARLRSLESSPMVVSGGAVSPDALTAVRDLLRKARSEGRTLLSEWESKQLLSLYGIPTVDSRLAATADDAVRAAGAIGFPVVVKLNSLTITHKSDVGGVVLNVLDADGVRTAFERIRANVSTQRGPAHFQGVTVQAQVDTAGLEVICGASPDPQFGPVLLFGTGGKWVEVYKDKALALPPLTPALARRMMEKTKVWSALQGARGLPAADLPALERVLVRLSELVLDQSMVKELEINPLSVRASGVMALDARIVLNSPEEEALRPRPAIRPYPLEYVTTQPLPQGRSVLFRPIRPEDEHALEVFHETLSERTILSRYLRPFDLSARTAPERLRRVCYTDYDREMVFVACPFDAPDAPLWAVGRLSHRPGGEPSARFSLLVSDPHQKKGLGTAFLQHLMSVAAREGLSSVWADIRQDNTEMLKILSRLGFDLMTCADGTCRARRAVRVDHRLSMDSTVSPAPERAEKLR